MVKSKWILLTALMSFSAFGVTFEEKLNRVEYLEELTSKAVSMDIEAYRRELEYEKQNLPLEKRAENEANLLAEKVKIQVQKAYEAALINKTPDEAVQEVRAAIEKDLMLVSPELQEEIRKISFSALEDSISGGLNGGEDLNAIKKAMLKGVEDRAEFLNKEADVEHRVAQSPYQFPAANDDRDAEKINYTSKQELIDSLVSDRENTRWVYSSAMEVNSNEIRKADSKIGLQVKVEFLGVGISAGPTITFKREILTQVKIMAEGINPVLLDDGNFDFNKRDRFGRAVKQGGKVVRRFVAFICDATLSFETEYTGSGGFTVAGAGVGASASKSYSNIVSIDSRRIFVPEYIEGKSVTIKLLNDLCHNDFLRAKVTNNMTVKDSLNIMMKNVVSGLRFSHPKTKCAVDSHCYNWYNKELIGLVKIKNFPRCVEERREKYMACELRGVVGQNCPVYENGKRTSSGSFEYTCDEGLRCQKYQDKGWLSPSKGRCVPINPRTYVDPFELARRAARR
ncbi:MAG: hypothetical protein ACLGHN_03675 [Bacteriovoracia bacterium]